MKEVKINGFTYYWNEGKLFEDATCTNEINQKFMTSNEKMQLEVWVKYDGKPMWSFN